MGTVTIYLDSLEPAAREAYQPIVDAVHQLAPSAVEDVSYGMAAYKVDGKPLIGLRASQGHLSVFPFSPAVISAASTELAGYDLAKGTVRFTASHPLPAVAARRLVSLRLAEITAR